jgi:hypothetical protein
MKATDVMKRFNLSSQQLYLWRVGDTQKRKLKNGGKKYHYPPRLFEGVHFVWDKGKIEYTDEGVKQIKRLLTVI